MARLYSVSRCGYIGALPNMLGDIAAFLALIPLLGWPIRYIRKRFLPPPLSTSLILNQTYASDLGALVIFDSRVVRSTDDPDVLGKLSDSFKASFVAPAPLVLTLMNKSDSRDPRTFYICEVYLRLRSYVPPELSAKGMSLVQVTTIQAGGRGSEGNYSVSFRGSEPMLIPVVASAAAERGEIATKLCLEPSKYGEIFLRIFPELPGRYEFALSIEILEGNRRREIAVAKEFSIVECGDFDWAENVIHTFNWQDMTFMGNTERAELFSRWQDFVARTSEFHPPVPKGRRVTVSGDLSERPFGF